MNAENFNVEEASAVGRYAAWQQRLERVLDDADQRRRPGPITRSGELCNRADL